MNLRSLSLCTAGAAAAFVLGPATMAIPRGAATPAPSAPPSPNILHFIDQDGRDHYILGTRITRVQRAPYPDRSVLITVEGPTWNGPVVVSGEAGSIARAWATASGQTIDPTVIGVATPTETAKP